MLAAICPHDLSSALPKLVMVPVSAHVFCPLGRSYGVNYYYCTASKRKVHPEHIENLPLYDTLASKIKHASKQCIDGHPLRSRRSRHAFGANSKSDVQSMTVSGPPSSSPAQPSHLQLSLLVLGCVIDLTRAWARFRNDVFMSFLRRRGCVPEGSRLHSTVLVSGW